METASILANPASPVIDCRRLRLEPFSKRHLTLNYLSWINDPGRTRFSDQRHRRHTEESCRSYAASFRIGPNHFWAIEIHQPSLGHIGNLTAYLDLWNQTADLGILVGETGASGQGYATEAWLGVCDYLFRDARIRKITAGTLAVNEPMLALMKRAGMRPDGIRPRHAVWEGREVDIVHAALFAEDWTTRSIN